MGVADHHGAAADCKTCAILPEGAGRQDGVDGEPERLHSRRGIVNRRLAAVKGAVYGGVAVRRRSRRLAGVVDGAWSPRSAYGGSARSIGNRRCPEERI